MNPEQAQKDCQNTGDNPVLAADARTSFGQADAAFDAEDLVRLGGGSTVRAEFLLHGWRYPALGTGDGLVIYRLAAISAIHGGSFLNWGKRRIWN